MSNQVIADIIIKNGQVLTMNSNMDVIDDGVLIIIDNKIVDVGGSELLEQYSAKKTIDAKQGIVMPGMVNSHCHLPMVAFRGLGEEGIEDRLMKYFIPLEKEMLCRELIYDATIHGAIDMAMSGVTTYADMYYHVDEMAKATFKIGLRAKLGQTVVGFPVVDAEEPYQGYEYIKNIIFQFSDYETIDLFIAPVADLVISGNSVCKSKFKLHNKNYTM